MLKELPEYCHLEGEPYKKYMELSESGNNKTILDIGTYRGFSAFALCKNKNNKVYTFDIADFLAIELPENAIFNKVGGLEIDKDLIKKADIILLDVDPHDGTQEPLIFNHIKKSGFKGLLIIDDVNLNEGMKAFYNSIKLSKELVDWHHSGTGLIYFNG